MWNRYFALLVLAALLRIEFEMSRTAHARAEPQVSYLVSRPKEDQQQKEWADKAVKRYAAAQEKKWLRWQEAMFEKE